MQSMIGSVSTRVLVGEVMEELGRHVDALSWASAELQVRMKRSARARIAQLTNVCCGGCQEPINMNPASKSRAGM